MDKIKELLEKRKTVEKTIRDLQAVTKGDNARSFSDEERTQFDAAQTELKELDATVDQERADAARIAFDPGRKDTAQADDETVNHDPPADGHRRFIVPAKARCHAKLKAFRFEETPEENERAAYVAGHMYLSHFLKRQKSTDWLLANGYQRDMVEGSNPAGGFLVADEMQRSLIRLREEYGVFERYARRVPMGSDSVMIPRMLSDVTTYWPGEGASITESDATIGSAELIAKKLACLTQISTELDEDAVVDIGDLITDSMAYSMAIAIDDAAFNGDGTSTYGGVYGLANALHANATFTATGDGFDELTLADGHDCIGTVAQYPQAQNVWFMHSAGYWAWAARLQYAGGGNTVADLGNGPQLQWLGYPVVFVQGLTSTITAQTSTIIAYFGDLRLAASFGVRRGINTMVSADRYFENDLLGVKCTQRVAINIHERGDTIRNRPIVALQTASS